jgi:threonine dehydratase
VEWAPSAGDVLAARQRLADLPPTPAIPAGDELYLKLENLQPAGSFKVRGYLNAVRRLPAEELRAGVVTVSAGNAALAAAYVARRCEIPCKVVMYDTAPAAKRDGVRALGGEVLSWPRGEVVAWINGRGWEEMAGHFIHPFADPDVMAGHGTVALELAEQVPGLRRVLVPVGGGGLVTGIAAGLLAAGSEAEVTGVQSSGYPLWIRAFADGDPPVLTPDTIADGTTAPYDPTMRERLARSVSEWAEVPEADLRRGVRDLALLHKVVAEGAGALAYSAARRASPTEPTVAVVSGGNLDAAPFAALLTA